MSKIIIEKKFICPECRNNSLEFNNSKIFCNKCNAIYFKKGNKYIFSQYTQNEITNFYDKIKFNFKKMGNIYKILTKIISPVCPFNYLSKFLKKNLKKNSFALNLGSGNSIINKSIYNVDIFDYPNVDIVCNIEKLPIDDNSVDIITNIAVLEHVVNPENVIKEILRVLKKDGLVYCFFPFIQGFHASPYDYTRRTYEGMKDLYKDFEIILLKPSGGPTSGLLWIFQEWLALLFSFGSIKMHTFILFVLMLLTFPLKFLDLILIHHPLSKNISSGFVMIAKKK